MPNSESVLVQFSAALSELSAKGAAFVADVRSEKGERVSGVLWKPDAVVVSEQALPEGEEYEVRVGDRAAKARLAGRDEGTNVAVLRLETALGEGCVPEAAVASMGALALVLSAGTSGVASRLTSVRSVSGAWQSLAGGTIDQRVVLNTWLGRGEEGGPVLGADGSFIGMSTRGARRETLVIPASTVIRAAAVLLERGSVERGWLGVSLHPVALPETLRPEGSQRVGLMVMEVTAGSPAAKAGILAGDIVLSAGGAPATRPRKIAQQLGADSIGKTLVVSLARAGAIVTCEAVIEARKA